MEEVCCPCAPAAGGGEDGHCGEQGSRGTGTLLGSDGCGVRSCCGSEGVCPSQGLLILLMVALEQNWHLQTLNM